MQISSFSSARSFFKTGRFRSRKQKPTAQEGTTTTTTTTIPPSINPTAYTTRNPSIDTTRTKSSLWTSVSRRTAAVAPASTNTPNNQSQNRGDSHDPDTVSQQPRRSDDTMREPVKIAPPFQNQRTISPALLDDTDYQALGFFAPGTQRAQSPSSTNTSRNASRAASPGQPPQLENMFELDVPTTQISRERRPDLQVKIPLHTPPAKSPHLLSAMQMGAAPPSAISTAPSSLPTGRYAKSATTATPRSIVSPFTAIEMSADNRFTADNTPTHKQHGNSYPDQRQQNMQRSQRTSMVSELGGRTPVVVNATTVRLDANHPLYTSHAQALGNSSRKNSSTNLNQPYMHRKGSTVSIASQANVHKPLPPEPPTGMGRHAVPPSPSKHIAYSTASPSMQHRPQTSSKQMSTAKTMGRPSPLKSGPPSPESQRPFVTTRRGSESSLARSTTLRSKYTPKDLDSMDEAFQRRTAATPTHRTPTSLSRSRASPDHSQLSLHPIAEGNYPPNSQPLAIVDEPLQISRGPMRMEPTRRPPQPPPPQPMRVQTTDIDSNAGSKSRPAMSRTQSNTSMRTARTTKTIADSGVNASLTEPTPTKRKMNGRTNTVSKADRILGLSATSGMARQMYDARGPDHNMSTSVNALLDDSEEDDFYEIRGKKDAQFEEIHSRLKLLSAKEDPAATFDAWHEENDYQTARWEEKQQQKDMEEKTETKPTIEEKLHLTGTLEGNPIVPTFIAELPAEKTPSPVELQGCEVSTPVLDIAAEDPHDIRAELGVPSPDLQVSAPPLLNNNLDVDQADRRGRMAVAPPLSMASQTSKSFRSNRSMRVQSLASIAASDIPDYYANGATSTTHSKRPSMAGSEYEEAPLSAKAAEQVLLHILQSLDNLEDLFSAARVSKGFYRTFKRNELYLLKHAIWKMSPAAWELREMSIPFSELPATAKDYTPALYFTYYVQDLLTMVELKAMILESCRSFLRPETISGLTGETERSSLIDDAFWRVWTFCKIFGGGTKREEDIVGQMDWLRGGVIARQSPDRRTLALTDELARNSVLFNPPAGFGKGNGQRGLTAEELWDMMEIWTCLGVLVQGYHGKRQEARDYGIYDRCNIEVGDVVGENAMLEEWTNHLLTLAPSTVLDVTSPATPTRTQFAQARSQGYTKWAPPKQGMSRSTFLKEAVARVYEESMAQRRPVQQPSTPAFSTLVTLHPSVGADAAVAAKERIQRHQAEIRKRKEDPEYKNLPVSDERPLSNYSDVLDRLEAISVATDAPPMPKLPGLAARLSRAKSERSSILVENVALRPPSPAPTTYSSAASMQISTPGHDNLSSTDLPAQTTSNKFIKKMRHPWARNRDTSDPPQPLSKQGVNRFASIRNNQLVEKSKTKEGGSSAESLPKVPSIVPSDEKFAILPDEDSSQNKPFITSPTRDPVEAAMDTLIAMGYDKDSARKALTQTSAVGGINFDAALSRLRKDKERKKRLERLDTMG